jgi:hypothetical protein
MPTEEAPDEAPVAEDVSSPASTRGASPLMWLAALVIACATALGAVYIYRSTDPPDGNPSDGDPPAPNGVAATADPKTSGTGCVWRPPQCEIECDIDPVAERHDCPDAIQVEFDSGKARAIIDVPSKDDVVSVTSTFCQVSEWAFHFADSPTCNGGGGDAGTFQYNAELQLVNGDLSVFDSDPSESNIVMFSRAFPDFIGDGCVTRGFHFADKAIAVDGLCKPMSGALLRLDPPTDSEGEPDRRWYLGLNTTFLDSGRTGSGAKAAHLCIGPRYEGFPVREPGTVDSK